jgi:hypothetical protein
MVLVVECVIAIALFTAIVVPSTAKNPLAWIGDYPPAIRRRCEELGIVKAKEARFTTAELVRKAVGIVVLLFALVLLLSKVNGATTFWQGFRDSYVIWLAIAWWDAIVIDCGWFCHSKRVRLPGTEDMSEYHDYLFHVRQSCIGSVLGLPVCLLVGLVVQLL